MSHRTIKAERRFFFIATASIADKVIDTRKINSHAVDRNVKLHATIRLFRSFTAAENQPANQRLAQRRQAPVNRIYRARPQNFDKVLTST